VVSLQTDGTIVFAPPANYSGEATFKVKLAGVANPVTVKVAIAPVADLPVLNTGSAGFDKGDPVLSLGAWVSDPDSESLTVTITGFPPGTEFVDVQRPTVQVGELVNGAWVISSPADIALLGSGSGQLLMKLPENTTGTLSLSVTATAREGEASAFITRQLNIVLDTTITGIATGVVTEDGSSDDNGTTVETISEQLSVIDRTPSESSFKPVPLPSLVKQYGQFTFDESSGQWSFTLNQTTAQSLKEGETTSEALTVHSLDGTASQVITATIVGVNDAPKFTKLLSFEGDTVTAFADWTIAGSVSQTLEATDGNHAARLVSGSIGVTQLETFLGLQSGALALNPASQSGYYANATVGSALSTDVYLTAGQTLSFDWRFATGDYRPYNDFAFIAVSSSVTKLADVFAVGDYGALGWQTFTYTATTSGNHTVGFGVLDTGDSAVPSTLTIDNVVIGSDAAFAFQIAEDATGGTNVGQVLASDVDSDPLYYAIIGGDSLFVIDSNTGVISLAPGASLDGRLEDYDLTVEVRDRQDHSGFEDTATVTISVIVPEPAQQAQVADMILL
jgi:VCBS repeat-containing protein